MRFAQVMIRFCLIRCWAEHEILISWICEPNVGPSGRIADVWWYTFLNPVDILSQLCRQQTTDESAPFLCSGLLPLLWFVYFEALKKLRAAENRSYKRMQKSINNISISVNVWQQFSNGKLWWFLFKITRDKYCFIFKPSCIYLQLVSTVTAWILNRQ